MSHKACPELAEGITEDSEIGSLLYNLCARDGSVVLLAALGDHAP
jgi:hypothetical protein